VSLNGARYAGTSHERGDARVEVELERVSFEVVRFERFEIARLLDRPEAARILQLETRTSTGSSGAASYRESASERGARDSCPGTASITSTAPGLWHVTQVSARRFRKGPQTDDDAQVRTDRENRKMDKHATYQQLRRHLAYLKLAVAA
jgi:hypothetical protein